MILVTKRMEIAGSHSLRLPYESKCRNLHGHNWVVTVHVCAKEVNKQTGMILDFTHIKKAVHDKLDHQHINDVVGDELNPTAENMCLWIRDEVNAALSGDYPVHARCCRVDVQESEGNVATWKEDDHV